MKKVVWFPAWACQNYTYGKSYGERCPYCPYSLDRESNRLIYNDQVTSSDERAEVGDLVDFFRTNAEEMGNRLEISGGEPLMRQDLPAILSSVDHEWAITSNTLMSTAIDRLVTANTLGRCFSWTASWHPLSGMEDAYAHNVSTLSENGVRAKATVVLSDKTIPSLRDTLEFLRSLPVAGINWHLDTHDATQDVEAVRVKAKEIIKDDSVMLAGPPKSGVMCNKNGKLLAVSPDGTLYHCVSYAYSNKNPITKVNGSVKLNELPSLVEWCDDSCFACCDHIKHEAAQ